MAVHNMPMYDEKIPLNNIDNYTENKVVVDPSTVHHFYHKLFKISDNMNTATAKKIAIERTEFMKCFVNEFLEEWEGLK